MTDRPTAPDTFHLTRERLLSGELGEAIRRMDPKVHVLSDAERAASLAETLAARPRDAMPGGCGDVWGTVCEWAIAWVVGRAGGVVCVFGGRAG